MSALFNRLHNWIDDETLTADDLNNEFNNILDNLVAAELEGYSSINNIPSNSRMDSEVDPYPSSARSFASSIAGEIERLRFMLTSITGESHWYNQPDSTIATIVSEISALTAAQASPRNVVKSGAKSATDQPQVLIPDGTARSLTLKCSVTPLVVDINGTEYTFSSDQTSTGLTAAVSASNTALISNTRLTLPWLGVSFSKYTGEDFSRLTIGTVGANISTLVNQIMGFKVVNGANTEYSMGLVDSATTLSKLFRGFFYDSTLTNSERTSLSAGDTLTLLKLTYVFVKTDGTMDFAYTPLTYGSVSPATPFSGDFWYDTSGLGEWKKYNGSSFVSANCALVGACMQSSTATVAARTFPFFAGYNPFNQFDLDISSDLVSIQSKTIGQKISVAGNLHDFRWSIAKWTTTGNFASGVTFTASTLYWLYVTNTGEQIADTRKPHDRSADLFGWYHPYNPWRCVGAAISNGGGSAWETFITMGDLEKNQSPLIYSGSTSDSQDIDGFAISASSGSFATSSTTFVTVTNMVVALRTLGRPVNIQFIPSGTGRLIGATSATVDYQVVRDLGTAAAVVVMAGRLITAVGEHYIPGGWNFTDLCPAGKHTWTLQVKVSSGADEFDVESVRMSAYSR
jgi:hypothetical protein